MSRAGEGSAPRSDENCDRCHPCLSQIATEEKQPGDGVLNLNQARQPEQEDSPEEVQDITHEAEDDSLSIEKKERELIMRALRKNNNKRKYAARDLGISERTLYRKIKEYELEE